MPKEVLSYPYPEVAANEAVFCRNRLLALGEVLDVLNLDGLMCILGSDGDFNTGSQLLWNWLFEFKWGKELNCSTADGAYTFHFKLFRFEIFKVCETVSVFE